MDLSDINDEQKNGIIIAPAGCGKTETIINIIKNHDSLKKILVLTHTNAGIENIEKRLKQKNVSKSKYNIYTIASFCYKYAKSFSNISNFKDDEQCFENTYLGMKVLLDNPHIKKILINTYSLMLVDEYQDCSLVQHEIIKKISRLLNYKVFGDPLQKIYDFKDENVNVENVINKDFPLLGYMTYPWRWENYDKHLGNWIMNSRKKLEINDFNIFSSIPNSVEYIHYKDYKDFNKAVYKLLKLDGKKAILFNLENQAQACCKRLGGKFYFQEEVECKILKNIINYIDCKNYNKVIQEFIFICKNTFTNFSTIYNNIEKKIKRNDFDFSRITNNIEEAKLFSSLHLDFNFFDFFLLINKIEENKSIVIYRKELWSILKIVIKRLSLNDERTAKELLFNIRNSRVLNSKFKYNNLVSRILLVKGLEFDNVLLINPNILSKELFYVAISRPTKHLIVLQSMDK